MPEGQYIMQSFEASPSLKWVPHHALKPKEDLRPFYTFLFKIASRCNLDCSYCYVYQTPDQSWRTRPKFMSFEIATKAAERIADHVRSHNLPEVVIVFHGGEPLLAGPKKISQYISILRETIPCKVDLAIQTNGTLLNSEILDILTVNEVKIGISIDGDREAHDRNRVYHNGRGSFDDVSSAVKLIESRIDWWRNFGGFLAVIDLETSPERVYQALTDLNARSLDLILPDCHHDTPPQRPVNDIEQIAYGQWLADFFDLWYGGSIDVEVRYLEEIISLLLKGGSSLESIGGPVVDLIVIETDGSIEPVDTLKAVGRAATDIGFHVLTTSFNDARHHPAVYSRMMGSKSLCSICQNCSELTNCGGGYLPHRYRTDTGFLNPSVYCNDIKYLLNHIRQKLKSVLS